MSDNPQSPAVKKEPIVIHLGRKSRKEIKKYKKGIGNMFMEVQQVISRTNAGTTDDVIPMVVLHKNKKKKKKKKKKYKL